MPFMESGSTDGCIFHQLTEIAKEYYSYGHRGEWAYSIILDDGSRYVFYTDSHNEVPFHQREQCAPHLEWGGSSPACAHAGLSNTIISNARIT